MGESIQMVYNIEFQLWTYHIIFTYLNVAGAIALSGNAFGERESNFLLSSVSCTGLESNLLNCSKGTNVCDSPFRDAGVICQGWLLCYDFWYMCL